MKRRLSKEDDGLTFSRTQVYLILGCIVAIAVLSFSLGHLVTANKGTSEQKTAIAPRESAKEKEVIRELDRLEARLDETDMATGNAEMVHIGEEVSDTAPEAEDVSFSFPEKLKEDPRKPGDEPEPSVTTETGVKVKSIGTTPRKRSDVPVSKQTDVRVFKRGKTAPPPVAVTHQPDEVDRLIASAESSSAAPEQKPKPATPAQQPSYDPKYTVQAGSFPSEDEARIFLQELKRNGYDAYVQRVYRQRVVWHRVRVGKFSTRSGAEAMVTELKKKEHLSPIVQKYAAP